MKLLATTLVLGSVVAGCYANEEFETETGDGVSATVTSELTVGGHYCPTRGEIAGRTIPSDQTYFITTFGGGVDTQRMACSGTADGRWMYLADSWRFGCGARVKITNPRTGRWCVGQVADVGPNICVERAAGRAVIDASPVITRELFGRSGMGWSDRVLVRAELVARTTNLGCGNGATTPTMPAPMPAPVPAPAPGTAPGSGSCFSGTYGREMPRATCLQSRFDRLWYQCASNGWIQGASIVSTRRGAAGACTQMISL